MDNASFVLRYQNVLNQNESIKIWRNIRGFRKEYS